jgi:hypothetical protein
MPTSRLTGLMLVLALAPAAAFGAEDKGGRYTMSPTDDGVVRLDTRTGAMALCNRKADRWVCEDMEDSQRRLMAEIDKLRSENEFLKAQVEHLEETLGLGDIQPPDDTAKPGTMPSLPSEEDVDKAFDYLEGMLKKLRDRMEKLNKEHGREPGTPL